MTSEALAEPKFRLKLWPILAVIVLGLGVPYVGAYASFAAIYLFHLPVQPGGNLGWLHLQHGFQLAVALLVILVLKRFVPTDYGLHRPQGKSYVWPAIWWGIFFGVLMTLVDYAPQLLAHKAPDPGFPMTPQNIAGWTFFEGVYVGPTEEIPFRAMLVPFLAATMPGKLRIGSYEMNWAGVIVALIFAVAHASNFWTRWWPLALGQQLYAFALGVLYAYWLEKSKSVLAPIIGHNVGDVTEYLIIFGLIALWP